MSKEKTVRGLSRNFIIPVGSQVVLMVAKTVGESAEQSNAPAPFKKPGSVAVVMKSPPHNDQPYLIQFSTGEEIHASFDELALRRREIDQLLKKPQALSLIHI